ncbi:LLM class flavin-dependent oxidoreductase [Humidisolicoccus flavus]|uniref:LLM class flavin-dependent oxidoreductase n=1 Tax=Humidisolicoccus flavus TaxID=3111414 RepID=UPI00324F3405
MSNPRGSNVILNVNTLGFGQRPAAWKFGGQPKDAFLSSEYWQTLGRIAERGTLDAIFLADSPQLEEDPKRRPTGNLEPTGVLTTIAAATEHLGLIGTATTTFNDPFELAERFATLDFVSGGRAAWNVVTTYGSSAAKNFGLEENPPRDERYARADEFVSLVKSLWANRFEGVAHDGAAFSLHGGLRVPHSPQGSPLLVQAGGSPQGRALAAKHADVVFSAEMELGAGLEHYQLVKDDARAAGRDPDSIRILPGLSVTLGSTEAEARERFDTWERGGPDGYGLGRFAGLLGPEVFELELDERIPNALLERPPYEGFTGSLGFRESFIRFVQSAELTVRELLRVDGGYGHRSIVGTPEQVADAIEHWFLAGAADGFNIMPGVLPLVLEDFVDGVIPLLRERGLFRTEYGAPTLRGRLLPHTLETAHSSHSKE